MEIWKVWDSEDRDFGSCHIKAAALVQVCSIDVTRDVGRGHTDYSGPLEVYGEIYVIESDNSTTCLYNRDADDPEIIDPVDRSLSLTLTGPVEGAIPISGSSLSVCLKDRAYDDTIIAQGCFYFEDVDDQFDVYEQLLCKTVSGKSGFARVSYVLLPRALVAEVTTSILHEGDKYSGISHVCGNITSSYEITNSGQPSGDTPSRKFTTVLYKSTSDDAESLMDEEDNPFVLSSSSVALPPYSTLVIGLELYEPRLYDEKYSILLDWVRFTPQHFGKVSRDLSIKEDGKVVVRVEVEWWSVRLKPPISEASTGAIKPKQGLPLVGFPKKPFMLRGAGMRGILPLMEIFSIFVGHQKNKDLRFYGEIDIQDSVDKSRIFERGRSSAVKLCPSSGTLPIVYRPYDCFMGDRMYMMLNLKDVEGSVVIRGYLAWTLTDYDSPNSWLDCRISSVIQGVNGYAAVNYTFLSRATPVYVKIIFCSKGSSTNYIHGRIVAWYQNHVYLTKYDKDYYQTILFNRSPDDGLLVTNQSVELPLSRSVFGVPVVNSSLIVDVDLSTDHPDTRLKDTIEFQVDIPSHERIEGPDCFIHVYTYW